MHLFNSQQIKRKREKWNTEKKCKNSCRNHEVGLNNKIKCMKNNIKQSSKIYLQVKELNMNVLKLQGSWSRRVYNRWRNKIIIKSSVERIRLDKCKKNKSSILLNIFSQREIISGRVVFGKEVDINQEDHKDKKCYYSYHRCKANSCTISLQVEQHLKIVTVNYKRSLLNLLLTLAQLGKKAHKYWVKDYLK